MSASQHCKALGLKSIKEASEISGVSTQTLNNWFKNRPFVFFSVIEKASKGKK